MVSRCNISSSGSNRRRHTMVTLNSIGRWTYPQENTSSVLFQLTQTTTPVCFGSLRVDIFNFMIIRFKLCLFYTFVMNLFLFLLPWQQIAKQTSRRTLGSDSLGCKNKKYIGETTWVATLLTLYWCKEKVNNNFMAHNSYIFLSTIITQNNFIFLCIIHNAPLSGAH